MSETRHADITLARYASAMFWMGRHLERAENLARLLDIIHTFSPGARGEQNWQSVLAIHCDEAVFAGRYGQVTGENVLKFYITDTEHPNSLTSCVRQARVNATQLRAVIGVEMWVQINVMHNFLATLKNDALDAPTLPGLLSKIRRQAQAFTGITEGGLYRGQGWYFYGLGKYLERADQITRLLDIKYHLLLPSIEVVGSAVDVSQWFLLLRAAGVYHSFRRENHGLISPALVAEFLLIDTRSPRSVAFAVRELRKGLQEMHAQFGLGKLERAIQGAVGLESRLRADTIEQVIAGGLHEYLDRLQLELIGISDRIAESCF